MRRLKTVISITGLLLLILSAASIYVALQSLSELRPAKDYEDQGILTFKPYAVYPVQVENTGSGRSRRMNPTRTVYMVYYRATDGSGYQWTDEVASKDQGLEVVKAGAAVKRRVLSIPEDRTYITVEPEQTAGSYTEGLRRRYTGIVTIGTLYILFYVTVLLLTKLVRRLRQYRAENTEMERFGPEIVEPKPRRWGWIAVLLLLLAVLLAVVFWSIGHQAGDPVTPDDGWSGDGGIAPVNGYVPPANEEGYCVFEIPPSLLGNKTPEELLEEWREALENVAPKDMDRLAWTELRANEDGGVSYLCTPEQYERMKQSYYFYGTQIFPAMFGIDPGEIIKRISYAEIDENGIPWGVDVWIDQAAFAGGGSFSDFIANFVPMTMIGRYQLMCGVPADEWAVQVTVRDAETDEVLFERSYSSPPDQFYRFRTDG